MLAVTDLCERNQVMKVDGACHCGSITIEAEVDPEKRHDLPLHRLPDRDRHGLSRFDPGRRANTSR